MYVEELKYWFVIFNYLILFMLKRAHLKEGKNLEQNDLENIKSLQTVWGKCGLCFLNLNKREVTR